MTTVNDMCLDSFIENAVLRTYIVLSGYALVFAAGMVFGILESGL